MRVPDSLPDPTRPAGTATDAMPFDHIVCVMMENHSFDNLLGALPRLGPAQGRRPDVRQAPGRRPTRTRAERHGARRSAPQHRSSPGASTRRGTPPTSRSTAARWTASSTRVDSTQPMGYWTDEVLPFAYSLARTFCARQPLVLLGSVPDVPQPPLPDGRHGLRRHLHRHAEPAGRAPAERHDLRPAARVRDQLDATTSPTCRRRRSSRRSSRSTRPNLAPDRAVPRRLRRGDAARRSASSTPSSACCRDIGSPLASLPQVATQPAVAEVLQNLNGVGGDEEGPQDMYYGEAWAYQILQAVLALARLVAHAADLHLRRARRLLRPRAAAGRDRARLDPARPVTRRRPGRLQPVRAARPRDRRLALLKAERSHQRGARPHLGAGDDRGEVEPARR